MGITEEPAGARFPRETTEEDIHEFEQIFAEELAAEQALHDRKRHRYTAGRDPLDNYLHTSEWIARALEIQYPEAAEFVRSRGALFAMIARQAEKFQRLVNMIGQPDFLDPNQGEDESLRDTSRDISIIAKLITADAVRIRRRAQGADTFETK